MHRNIQKQYHIDYAFLSKDLISLATMEIGKPEEWLSISDHLPLVVEIGI